MLQLSRATVRAYGAPWRDRTSTCRRSKVSSWYRHGFRSTKKKLIIQKQKKGRVLSLQTWSSFIRRYYHFCLEMVRAGAKSAPSREIAIRVPHSKVQSRDLGFSERANKRAFDCALVQLCACSLSLTLPAGSHSLSPSTFGSFTLAASYQLSPSMLCGQVWTSVDNYGQGQRADRT